MAAGNVINTNVSPLGVEDPVSVVPPTSLKLRKKSFDNLPHTIRAFKLAGVPNSFKSVRTTCQQSGETNNTKLRENYVAFLEEVISAGYAEKVPQNVLHRSDGKVWFIPHHGVYHHKKPDKIRVFQGNGLKRVKACGTISVKNECAVQQSELDQTVQQSKLDQTNQKYATKLKLITRKPNL